MVGKRIKMSTYIIGDIHGYLNILEKLLHYIKFKPSDDHLWFTGDLINGGPYSTDTIRFIKELPNSNICVLGNHDVTLLSCAHNPQLLSTIFKNAINKNKLNGIEQVLSASDSNQLITWLQHRPLAHFDNNHNILLVHAGVHPTWNVNKTLQLAKEVELIFTTNNQELYKNLYGDEPNNWHETLTSWERVRCIINYLTRIRFCSINGQLDLHNKGNLSSVSSGSIPWYNIPTRQTNNVTVVFGHWAALSGQTNNPRVIALDTGCRWGYKLTAYCIEDQKLFYVDNN